MQVGHVLGSHLAVSMAKDGAAWEFGKVCMELKLQCLGAPINCALQKVGFLGGFFKHFGVGAWHFHGISQVVCRYLVTFMLEDRSLNKISETNCRCELIPTTPMSFTHTLTFEFSLWQFVFKSEM